jgi:hypothetical protein
VKGEILSLFEKKILDITVKNVAFIIPEASRTNPTLKLRHIVVKSLLQRPCVTRLFWMQQS